MRRREFIAWIGGAAASSFAIWPLAAHARQQALLVVGYLSGVAEDASPQLLAAFRQGLGETGFVEGRNVDILFRWAGYRYDRLPALAADLVSRRAAVIVATSGAAAALAAKAATTTIPIVFELGSDPIELGLVASLNRPGGNITGTTFLGQTLTAKRLEMLHEAVPAAARVGFLINSSSSTAEADVREAETAARILGVRLVILNATDADGIETAFATVAQQRIGALLTDTDVLFNGQRERIAALAARHDLPAIYHIRETVAAGGLMSYGANVNDAYRLAGLYTGRILSREKPADLPVQQSTNVELVINLKTANALGLTFPLTLLGRADEVIE
jgi:putative ABC transport system substrate-binding protein